MADREISIVLRAKNELQVGLAKARKELSDFGESIFNVGKWIGGAALAAGTAILGFATKAISSYAEAESAQKKLETAFRSFGEEVPVNVEKIKQLTRAIEAQTGVDDLLLQSRAAQLKMMGVHTAQLDQAIKASIAAERAGMGEEQAIRSVAQALEGNFESFNKYIPKLREAQTESEKAAIINDFLTVTYADQAATVDTIQGKWVAFKDAIADIWVTIGEAIAQNGALKDTFDLIITKIREYGNALTAYIRSDLFVEQSGAAKMFASEFSNTFQTAALYVKAFFESFNDATPIQYIGGVIGSFVNKTVEELVYLKNFFVETWEKIKHPIEHDFQAPSFDLVKQANKEFLNYVLGNHIEERTSAEKTLMEIERLRSEHNIRIKEISDEQLKALEANRVRNLQQEQVAASASAQISLQAGTAIVGANKNTISLVNDLNVKRADLDRQLNESIKQANQSSAASVSSNWQSAYKNVEEASTKAADIAVQSAERVSTAMANTGFNQGVQGGTVGSNPLWGQAVRNLEARGAIPASGTRLAPGQGADIQRAILAELERIRSQNERLLTFS